MSTNTFLFHIGMFSATFISQILVILIRRVDTESKVYLHKHRLYKNTISYLQSVLNKPA